jgi:hypothetical protein
VILCRRTSDRGVAAGVSGVRIVAAVMLMLNGLLQRESTSPFASSKSPALAHHSSSLL